MPIYEYICTKCTERFSMLQSIHSSEDGTRCIRCDSKNVKKIVSSFSYSSDTDISSSIPSNGLGGGG